MQRAAILIGVNRTGGLPALADAAAGARRMQSWALEQGMAAHNVYLFTDEANPVDIAPIRKAIRTLVESRTVHQLVIYFAGHGVNIRYGEYWLLSDAPVDASASVNVEGSVVLARRCGIPHVIFISDACRTAAEGVQAQGITGSEIFPNDPVEGIERPVDLFFATTVGRPALEVRSAGDSSAMFRAVYTDAVLDALSGKLHDCVSPSAGTPPFVVTPRSLKACLSIEVPLRISASGLKFAVNQDPDARITSDDTVWIAGFQTEPQHGAQGTSFRAADLVKARPSSPSTGARKQLDYALSASAPALAPASRSAMRGASHGTISHYTSTDSRLDVPGATAAGFTLRRAKLKQAIAFNIELETTPSTVALSTTNAVTNVLLVMEDDSSVVLPALPGYGALLTFERKGLIDVTYAPLHESTYTSHRASYPNDWAGFRDAVALAARDGVLRLERQAGRQLAARVRNTDSIDPAFAVYVAYALQGLRQRDLLCELREDQLAAWGVTLFDLDMLAVDVSSTAVKEMIHPPFPAMAQGWSLMAAYGASIDAEIAMVPDGNSDASYQNLQSHLVDTVWTQFKPTALMHLRQLMLRGKL